MEITPEMQQMARQELARRELAKRQNNNSSLQTLQNNNQIKFQDVLKDFQPRSGIDVARDLTQGALTDTAKAGQFIGDQMMKIPGAQSLANTIQTQGGYPGSLGNMIFPQGVSVQRNDMDKIFSPIGSNNQTPQSIMTKNIGGYLPFGVLGGASLLGQAGAGALYGASTSKPDQSNLMGFLPKDKSGAAIESALINALTHGAGKIIENLRPSRLLRGKLSPEELKENYNAAEGTPTNIGDIVGSPMLKRQYENVLAKIPFSGANEKMQQAGGEVINQGKNILNNLSNGENPESISDSLFSDLVSMHEQHKNIKNSLYDEFNKEAEKANIDLHLPRFSKMAKDYSDAIDSTNILKDEPDVRKIFNKLQNYQEPVKEITSPILDSSGKPFTESKFPTHQEANFLKSKLNEYAQDYLSSPLKSDKNKGRIFSNLSKSIKTDIQESLPPKLRKMYDEAEDNYQKNYSKFLDKDIYKYLRGKKDTDTLAQSFIINSKGSDRANRINKLATLLPQGSNKLSYAYFSRAMDNEGNLNPVKLNTLYKNLGPKQLKALVPDENMRNALKNYSKLYSMNIKGVNIMSNPMTGQQNLDVIPAALASAGAGGLLGGPIGYLSGLIAPGLISKGSVNWMTNPVVRKNLIDAMIKNKRIDTKITPTLQTLGQGLQNS